MCSFRLMIVLYSFDNCQKKGSKGGVCVIVPSFFLFVRIPFCARTLYNNAFGGKIIEK
ncbi:hypothetical protein GGQ57_002677 [Parabacteroides faecis]|uniref:Uncharacterized protein n=1 Tax=Parabacteroides faecis TaxID=1217282 RepID=A0ABR6KPJ5_9BACT|nr:hypothetical protein [Parabacteroides faecis]